MKHTEAIQYAYFYHVVHKLALVYPTELFLKKDTISWLTITEILVSDFQQNQFCIK